jgi:hypothetical protein
MKKMLFLMACIAAACSANGQSFTFYPYTYIKATDGHDTLFNAFAGGFAHPMFSNMDLNGDGLQDLVVFDRGTDRLSCFLAKRYKKTDYIFRTEYEHAFPFTTNWMWLVDYDQDGKMDVFSMTDPAINNTGLSVFKNISTGAKLKFKVAQEPVRSKFSYGMDQITNNATEIPAFADVDFDGDIDILTYASQGTSVRFYKNYSMERYGVKDSLDFELKEQCWGKYYEYPASEKNYLSLGFDCGEPLVVVNKKEHDGSSLLAYDFDNDGDMDLVVGDAGFSDLNFLENGRNPNTPGEKKIDTAILQRPNFPYSTRVDLPNMPQPCLVDIDNDGNPDMLVAPADKSTAPDKDFIWYYRNINNAKEPVFSLVKKNFLSETMIDPGTYSAPAFCDYNHDGLPDLMLSVSTNDTMGKYDSRLFLYLNTGTKTKAFFTLFSDDFLALSGKGYQQLMPCFGDIDGDGKEEMIAGTYSGHVLYFHNTGTGPHSDYGTTPDTLKYTRNGIQVPMYVYNSAAPAVMDLDGDGRTDLLVGSGNAKLYYYKNISLNNKMEFTLVSDSFGQTSDNFANKVGPCVVDLDNNGHPDLLLGTKAGEIWMYKDIDLQSGKFKKEKNSVYDYANARLIDPDFGYAITPAATKLDGDSLPDIVIGSYAGGLQLLTTINHLDTFTGVKPTEQPVISGLKLYPNPAAESITLEWQSTRPAAQCTISILDITGRICRTETVKGRRSQMDVKGLSPGAYIVRLVQDNNAAFTPLIIQH